MLHFRVLGLLDVQRVEGDAQPVTLTRPLERRLLAVLLAANGRVLSTDELIDALWPVEGPAQPERALQTSISRLRKLLDSPGPDSVVARTSAGYQLAVEADQIDARRFEAAVRATESLPPADRLVGLEQALDLWRGTDAYADFRYDDFAAGEAARLEDLRLGALEELFDARLATGLADAVIPDVEVLIKEHPLRERLYGMLMLALYRTGRQAEALRVFQTAASNLADLGIEPGRRLAELEEQILLQDPRLDLPDQAATGPNNLPSRMGTIVGRDSDLITAGARLEESRLLTITGPGGVGKTTLALELARRMAGGYPDGCWVVALDTIRDPDQVPGAIGQATRRSLRVKGISREESIRALIGQLAEATLLLVIDNCEHLVDQVAETVQRVLESCPGVVVLATSRERLLVPGEQVLPLAPFDVPVRVPPEVSAADAITRNPALQLFQDRARAIDSDFTITRSNLEVTARICRRLDGLPLAIELAAAQLGVLSLLEIDEQLGRRFELLRVERASAERHRTLEAAIEWSCQTLDEGQRRAVQRLATVSSPFTADLAARLTGQNAAQTLDLLRALRAKSLLQIRPSPSPETRYEFLQSIRAFARQRAEEAGTVHDDLTAHAAAFRELAAEASSATLGGAGQLHWLRLIDDATTDFEKAIDTLLAANDVAAAMEIFGNVGWVFLAYRRQEKGYRIVEKVLGRADGSSGADLARVHITAGGLLLVDGVGPDLGSGRNVAVSRHFAQAREIAEAAGAQGIATEAMLWEGHHHWYRGDPDKAIAALVPIRSVGIELGLDRAVVFASLGIGMALNVNGAHDEAIFHIRESLELATRAEDGFTQSWAYTALGSVLRDAGDLAGSAAAYRSGFLIAARLGLPLYSTVCAAGEGLSHWLAGNDDDALEAATRALTVASSRPGAEAYLSFQTLIGNPTLGMNRHELGGRIRLVLLAPQETRAHRVIELFLDLLARHVDQTGLAAQRPIVVAALARIPLPRAAQD